MEEIIKLDIENFCKCGNIWNMEKDSELKERFYQELIDGNRITFVMNKGEEYIAEISLVFEKNDVDYTIPNKRIYVSRVMVKKEYRGQGYGKKMMNYVIDYAKKIGYEEMTIGVDLDNYVAIKLYVKSGFNKILFIGEDEGGKYLKLIKKLK